MEHFNLRQPDDWHIHLRDGDKLARTVTDAAKQFGRALVMPNLQPPIIDTTMAEAYRQRIITKIPQGCDFVPYMTLYLTNNTRPETIQRAAESPYILAAKLYPAGATTNSDQGVTQLAKIYSILEIMQKYGLVLCVHGEVTDPAIDIFDREAQFIEQHLIPIVRDFPELKIILEHITTKDAVDFIKAAKHTVAATITAHHLLHNRNDLLAGGIKPHYYCLPILKRSFHQQALITAATSGNSKFFLGTDSAPHSISAKQSSCGCAGIYTAHAAIELYAQAFEAANALDKLENFASVYGANFYGLVPNEQQITLVKQSWQVPESLSFGEQEIKPLAAGEQLAWQLEQMHE